MLTSTGFIISILAAGSALFGRVAAQQNASTFIFTETVANLTLSLTAVAQTGDLWFRLSAPAEYDWVAIGVGHEMKGALTFITYPTTNGTAITLSPRLSSGNTEPEYNSNINAYKVDLTNHTENFIDAANGGAMQIAFVCKNCTNWSDPPLDLNDTQAPFMFAVGPISDQTGMRWFNTPSAPLREHSMWGQFTMDMTVATVQSPDGVWVPQLANNTVGASATVTALGVENHDYGSAFHAITMCLAIGLLLPLDTLIYKLFRRVKIHMWLQGIVLALFVIGLGLGFWISIFYVRVSRKLPQRRTKLTQAQSKDYNSPHQIIGLIMIVIIIVELAYGVITHRRREASRKLQSPPPSPRGKSKYTSPGFIHGILGLLIFLIGVVDAAIGFDFAIAVAYNKLWVPLVLAVVIILLFVSGIRYCFDTNKKDQQEFAEMDRRNAEAWRQYQAEQRGQQQYGQQQYGQPQEYAPSQYGQSQQYGVFGAYKDPAVEMRPVGGGEAQYGQVTVPNPY